MADTSGLGSALGDFRKALASHKAEDGSTTPDLLGPANLKVVVGSAADSLGKAENEVIRGNLRAEQITERLNEIPRLVAPFQIDALYVEIAKVENALQQSLRSEVSTRNTYHATFERSSDTLTSEQNTLINWAHSKPLVSTFIRSCWVGMTRQWSAR